MDRTARLRDLFGRVFDSHREDLRTELPPDEYERRRHAFVFHLTDWLEDLDWFSDLTKNPDGPDPDAAEVRLVGLLYHVIPHLGAAGRLLLDHVPDPFADEPAAVAAPAGRS
jgi:hypothetical protein